MFEEIECFVCQTAFEPEEVNGVRVLKQFKGYTVDFRLRQYRKLAFNKLPEFIEFDSPRGIRLLSAMHKEAIAIANKKIAKRLASKK